MEKKIESSTPKSYRTIPTILLTAIDFYHNWIVINFLAIAMGTKLLKRILDLRYHCLPTSHNIESITKRRGSTSTRSRLEL